MNPTIPRSRKSSETWGTRLESDMREAAKRFEFEKAAKLRDTIKELRTKEFFVCLMTRVPTTYTVTLPATAWDSTRKRPVCPQFLPRSTSNSVIWRRCRLPPTVGHSARIQPSLFQGVHPRLSYGR